MDREFKIPEGRESKIRIGLAEARIEKLAAYDRDNFSLVIVPIMDDDFAGCRLVLPEETMVELCASFLHERGYIRDFDYACIVEELEYRKKKGRV